MDGYVAPVEVIKNVVAVATVKKTKDIIHVASVEEESKYKLIVKKRRIIDYKSSVEEPKVEKETKFNCIHCEKGKKK